MKLVKSNFEILEQGSGLEGIYEAIERAGRTCYKSTRPEGQTAKDFVDRMIASKHYAMLEHGTVYLKVPNSIADEGFEYGTNWSTLCLNPYTKYISDGDYYYYSTNYRVIIENDLQGVLEYLCEPTGFHEKRVTVRFITDRGVSHEFVRHRVFSFAQESTRYCNYSKDKFGNELTFIIPSWLDLIEGNYRYIHETGPLGHDFYWTPSVSLSNLERGAEAYLNALAIAESHYMELLDKWDNKVHDRRFKSGFRGNPWTPQQARQVLPNALKTELVMTGFISDWNHFFDLRARGTTGAPHPDAKALAEPLMGEFYKRGYLDGIS